MKKLFPLLLLFFVAFAGTMIAPAEKPVTEQATVEGVLIDSKCYAMDHSNAGNDHGEMKACGAACAKMGIPVGVLEGGQEDGTVTLVIGPAAGYADFIAKEVRIEGTKPYAGAIIPEKFWIKDDAGKWKETPVPGTMM